MMSRKSWKNLHVPQICQERIFRRPVIYYQRLVLIKKVKSWWRSNGQNGNLGNLFSIKGHSRSIKVQCNRTRLLQRRCRCDCCLLNSFKVVFLACEEMGKVTLGEHFIKNYHKHCRQQIRFGKFTGCQQQRGWAVCQITQCITLYCISQKRSEHWEDV